MTGLSKQNRLVHTNIMNAATFPSPSASTASASTIMSRASEDILSQRKILKAARSPPLKTGISRASGDIIKQRKIVKVNKSWLGSPSPSCSSPAPCSTVHESAGPTPNNYSVHSLLQIVLYIRHHHPHKQIPTMTKYIS